MKRLLISSSIVFAGLMMSAAKPQTGEAAVTPESAVTPTEQAEHVKSLEEIIGKAEMERKFSGWPPGTEKNDKSEDQTTWFKIEHVAIVLLGLVAILEAFALVGICKEEGSRLKYKREKRLRKLEIKVQKGLTRVKTKLEDLKNEKVGFDGDGDRGHRQRVLQDAPDEGL